MDFRGIPNFDQIKFGPGVIGRLTTLIGVVVVSLLALAALVDWSEFRIGVAASIVLIVLVYVLLAFRHADRHPSTSVLEGAEAVRYHHQEIAAKGIEIEALPGTVREMTTPPASLLLPRGDENE